MYWKWDENFLLYCIEKLCQKFHKALLMNSVLKEHYFNGLIFHVIKKSYWLSSWYNVEKYQFIYQWSFSSHWFINEWWKIKKIEMILISNYWFLWKEHVRPKFFLKTIFSQSDLQSITWFFKMQHVFILIISSWKDTIDLIIVDIAYNSVLRPYTCNR